MGDTTERYDDNVPGAYYVDKNCVLCNVCFETHPAHFRMSDAGDHMIVHRQPETDKETAACREAMEECPMDAVGDDG
ncbi:MAG: ferredoxin [Planctomycetes bacterium]|nr:ferredoxin [Planctomycetota bacterium]